MGERRSAASDNGLAEQGLYARSGYGDGAGGGQYTDDSTALSIGPTHCRRRASLALADRCLFCRHDALCSGLKSAATDGVDVRLLVPGASDVPFIGPLSRAGYRPLLEAGVRVFEWNGSMLHAKTAVADSRWARVGSTNLNLTSWIGNWELDVAVEDEAFANAMEAMYVDDLSHATEVVLTARRRVRLSQQPEPRRRRPLGRHTGGTSGRRGARGGQRDRRGDHEPPSPWSGRGPGHGDCGPVPPR